MNTFIAYPGGGVSAPPTGRYPITLANPLGSAANPEVIRTTAARGSKGFDFSQLLGRGKAVAKAAPGVVGRYAPLLGGALELAQGDVPGAIGVTAGGYLGGALGTAIMPGVGTVIGAGLGSMVGGGLADAVSSTAGGLLPDLEILGVPLGERAKRRKESEYARGELKKDLELQQQLQGQYLNKTLAPFLDSQRRAQVTAQQSLLNTQGAIYQSLARQAGNFQLAGQGIESNTRLAEASLTQNPYSGSVIQAPNITFGRG